VRLLVLEVVVQPDVTGRGVLGNRATVGPDELRQTALGVISARHRQVAGPNRATVDPAARVDDGGDHLILEDRLAGVLQAVHADDLYLILHSLRLDHRASGQRHVIAVEEAALDVREALEEVLPERGDLLDLPVARRLIHDLDVRVLLERAAESLGAPLGAGVGQLSLGVDDLTLTANRLEELLGDRLTHVDVVRLQVGEIGIRLELFRILDQARVHDDEGDALLDDRIRAIEQGVAR